MFLYEPVLKPNRIFFPYKNIITFLYNKKPKKRIKMNCARKKLHKVHYSYFIGQKNPNNTFPRSCIIFKNNITCLWNICGGCTKKNSFAINMLDRWYIILLFLIFLFLFPLYLLCSVGFYSACFLQNRDDNEITVKNFQSIPSILLLFFLVYAVGVAVCCCSH